MCRPFTNAKQLSYNHIELVDSISRDGLDMPNTVVSRVSAHVPHYKGPL